jgi:hypothetical protein
VKRLFAALAALLGLAYVKRKQQHAPPAVDPAEELRAKLAQARAADDREEFESGEQAVDEVPDVDTRRREVHDRARAQIDDLSGNG